MLNKHGKEVVGMRLFSSRDKTSDSAGWVASESRVAIPVPWPELLREQIAALMALTGNTEEEFLSLGAQFHGFHAQATEIAAHAQEMVAQVSGEQAAATSASLAELVGRMERFLTGTEQEASRIADAFTHILALFGAVEEPLGNFKKINKVLRMLGTATKIESARMGTGAAGFETLANDVAAMSVQVVEKAANVLEQKRSLTATLQAALLQISGSEAVQSAHVRDTLQQVRRDVQLLDGVHGRCSAGVDLVNRTSREMADGISQVVMSMQSHDITRQQIEHVHEALAELVEHCTRPAADDAAVRQVIQEAGDICELQAAQLQHAAAEFNDAVGSICRHLHDVAGGAAGLSHQISDLMGVADEAGSSFLQEMERSLVFVNTTLAESARVNQELARVMERVADKVSEIALFVKEIAFIGGEIELIALNAQIKSARAGVEGAALGVLAEAIQRLSAETGELTSATSSILLQITTATEQLCSGVDAGSDHVLHDVQEMVAEVDGLMVHLRRMNGTLGRTSTEMHRVVADLGDAIHLAVGSISVHETIRRVAEEVATVLNTLGAEAQALVPSAVGGSGSERLKKLADRYTMQSERLVHARIAGNGSALAAPVAGAPSAQSTGDDGLGDNVELF
jgi:DNA integrity scanning protein DisA with diadenylate cyclase activity